MLIFGIDFSYQIASDTKKTGADFRHQFMECVSSALEPVQ